MVKKPPPDFKRKVVKVGRKVKRENVTKISINAKKVHVPLQQLDASRSLESEDTRVSQISKQLHHFSSTNRVGALHELKQIFGRGEYTSKHIAIVLPSAMELLFDVEKDTRQALKDLIVYLVQNFDTLAFTSIRNIIVTYCCSGLTHLEKDIRLDALQIIQYFTPTHIFQHDIEKIISHIVTLLHDREILSQITISAKKTPLLMLCLQVIASILRPPYQSAAHQVPIISQDITSAYFINTVKSCNVSSPAPLSATTCTALLCRFQYFWTSLTLGETNISHNNMQLLNTAVTITALLTHYEVFAQRPEFSSLIHLILRVFPYQCTEVQQSINISISTKQLLAALRNFNLSVCSLFYQYVTVCSESRAMNSVDMVQEYVKSLLHDVAAEEEVAANDAAALFATLQMQIAYDIRYSIATNTVDILRDLCSLLRRSPVPVLLLRIITTTQLILHNDFLFAELAQSHISAIFELGELLAGLPLLPEIDEEVVCDVLRLVLLIVQRHSDANFSATAQYFTEAVYGRFVSSRTLLLSIFYYSPFDNLHVVLKEVCNCVAKYRRSEEESFLMQIFYSRRTEMQLSHFLQLTLDYYLHIVKCTSSTQLESMYNTKSHPLLAASAHISDLYHWCSSNTSPLQILQVLNPMISKMVQNAVKKWEAHDRLYAVYVFVQTLVLRYVHLFEQDTNVLRPLLTAFCSLLAACTLCGQEGGVINLRIQNKKSIDLNVIVQLLCEFVQSDARLGSLYFNECKDVLLGLDAPGQSNMLRKIHSFLFAVKQYENYNVVFEDAANVLEKLRASDKLVLDSKELEDVLKFVE